MTTIIMLEGHNAVYVAADRLTTAGTYKDTLTVPKFNVVAPGVVVGACGAAAFQRRLVLRLADIVPPGGDLTLDMVCNAVVDTYASFDDIGGTDVLVGLRGEVYEIDRLGHALRPSRGYGVIGSGAGYALGALHVLAQSFTLGLLSGERLLNDVMPVAAAFDPYTGAPFDIERIETP